MEQELPEVESRPKCLTVDRDEAEAAAVEEVHPASGAALHHTRWAALATAVHAGLPILPAQARMAATIMAAATIHTEVATEVMVVLVAVTLVTGATMAAIWIEHLDMVTRQSGLEALAV